MENLQKFVHQHENNPIYLASKKILNHEDVNYDLQNLVLKSIFENINKDSKKIDLMFPLIAAMSNYTPEHFIKSYQNKIKEIPNELINVALFNSIAKQPSFNVYKTFNMHLESDELYKSIINDDNKKIAFSYNAFIGKIKDALSDNAAIPFPYSISENKESTNGIIKKINLNLIDEMKFLFKYANTKTAGIIFNSFINDVRYLYKDEDNKYHQDLSKLLLISHPNFFHQLKESKNLGMPRKTAVDYFIQNATYMNEVQFQHFSRAFHTHHIDADIIVEFASEKLKNQHNENLEKNIKFFKELLFANSAESIINNPQTSHHMNGNRYKI